MAVEVGVRRVGPADLEGVAECLAAAFVDDPVFSWLIPPSVRRRERRTLQMFRATAAGYLRKSQSCFMAEGDAVALWTPPGSWEVPPGDIVGEVGDYLRALRWRSLHAIAALSAVEGAHPKAPPHWYLAYLGTRPSRQGQGYGARLLREVLDLADRDGTPAYLESSNRRNQTLYLRHGFEVVEELRLPWGGPPVWRMWREPRPPS